MAFPFEETIVYDALFLREQAPTFFVGCFPNVFKVIQKKEIPADMYMLASYSRSKGYSLLPDDTCYKRKRLLILASWVEKHIPEFVRTITEDEQCSQPTTTLIQHLPPLPPLAKLPFTRVELPELLDSSRIQIRMPSKTVFNPVDLLFCLKDVECILDLPPNRSLLTAIIHNFLTEGEDFIKFASPPDKIVDRYSVPCELYLTFQGYLRLLYHHISHPFAKDAHASLMRMLLPRRFVTYVVYLLQSLPDKYTLVAGVTSELDSTWKKLERQHNMEFKLRASLCVADVHLESVLAEVQSIVPAVGEPFICRQGQVKYYMQRLQVLQDKYCGKSLQVN